MTLNEYIEWLRWRKYIWDRERLEEMRRELRAFQERHAVLRELLDKTPSPIDPGAAGD